MGVPACNPLSPVLSANRLYAFILPGAPKKNDLLRDGRFAPQTLPRTGLDFRKEGEEFYMTGRALRVHDPGRRRDVLRDTGQHVGGEEAPFELMIDRVMYMTWRGDETHGLRPVRRVWRAPSAASAAQSTAPPAPGDPRST